MTHAARSDAQRSIGTAELCARTICRSIPDLMVQHGRRSPGLWSPVVAVPCCTGAMFPPAPAPGPSSGGNSESALFVVLAGKATVVVNADGKTGALTLDGVNSQVTWCDASVTT